MSIVLAIEPDRRQAAHLTAIARHLVDTELLLADTTEGALDAIGDRVPDLVLVPALLSPQDDAALAAALRVIATAAHVRTLTIPVLANGTKRQPSGGMLSKWRRSRAASQEPEGCDPAVFGEQISTYLKETAAERAEMERDSFEEEPLAVAQPNLAVPERAMPIDLEFRHHSPTLNSDADVEPAAIAEFEPVAFEPVAFTEVEPVAVIEPPASPIPAEAPCAESIEPWAAEAAHASAEEPIDEALIDLSGELAELSDDADDDEMFDGERVGVYTISAEADEPANDAFDLLRGILEQPAMAEAVAAPIATIAAPMDAAPDAPSDEPAFVHPALVQPQVAEPVFVERMVAQPVFVEPALFDPEVAEPMFVEPALVDPEVAEPVSVAPMFDEPVVAESSFVEPPEAPRADIEPWVPMYLTPGRMWPTLEGMPAETPVARTEQPDWIELVASLRQDLERRRTEPPSAAVDPIAARLSDGAHADSHRLVKRQKAAARKAKPIQDEWGFFDPEQCGFSTLLAKLDEITDEVRR